MPTMPRTNNKARNVAFSILGIPVNMEGFYPKKKSRGQKIEKDVEQADVQEHFKRTK